jgi:hypothetical protein
LFVDPLGLDADLQYGADATDEQEASSRNVSLNSLHS